jgi:dihydrofolate synthase/folylpolyglutamate synthase
MQGGFQLENAALAVASLDLLAGKGELALAQEDVKEGVSVSIPGRLEVIQSDPIVILDGAHNRHKAKALSDSLVVEFPGRKMIVVLGTLSIKDFSGIIQALAPLTDEWIATQPKVLGKPAAPASALGDVIRTITPDQPIEEVADVSEAVELALQHAGKDGIVLVTGSLYMLGEVRNRWISPDEILKNLEQMYQSSRKSTNLR